MQQERLLLQLQMLLLRAEHIISKEQPLQVVHISVDASSRYG